MKYGSTWYWWGDEFTIPGGMIQLYANPIWSEEDKAKKKVFLLTPEQLKEICRDAYSSYGREDVRTFQEWWEEQE